MKTAQKIKLTITIIVIALAGYAYLNLSINLGLDLQGGTRVTLEAQDTQKFKVDNDSVLGALAVIRNRVNALGVSEPVIRRKGFRQIVVELPGVSNPERAIKLIGETALLEFVEAEWAPGNADILTPEKLKILAGEDARLSSYTHVNRDGSRNERPIILKKTAVTGKYLKAAFPGVGQNGQSHVSIEFDTKGAELFGIATAKSVGKPLAILLDNKIISAPNVNEPINGGRAIISGDFSATEIKDLVIKLKAGALPVPVEVISNKVVGPTLGQDSITKSKKAAIIGLALLMVYMIGIYRVPGVMASLSLVIYLLLIISLLKAINATLTLPGIAGIILTIGMAVDANIIIFERIKEEREAGVGALSSISNGFKRAFKTIVDANVTTVLAALLLFWLGTGTIKGFALTLSIGIILSMFTAIVVTRLLIDAATKLLPPKEKKSVVLNG